LFDVDGVMTDGRLLIGADGEPRALFHARDGTALQRLSAAGVRLAVVSGRDGAALRGRFERLGVDVVRLGVRNKGVVLDELLDRWSLAASDVAMVGDDHIDLPVLRRVGLAVAPADAPEAVRRACHLVTTAPGGRGVLSELADRWLAAEPVGVRVGDVVLAQRGRLALLAGLNVLETRDGALRAASRLAGAARAAGLPLVFKASYDKANRSAGTSFRGPGLQTGLRWLSDVRDATGLPLLTDVHEPAQCAVAAEVVDLLQIPAFLVRQTDLVTAAARTGRPLHLKKMTTMAPGDMEHAARKADEAGATGVVLCERGTAFGYANLVVDPLAFAALAETGRPVSFDVTHAVQTPGSLGNATGGRRAAVPALARVGVAAGLAALFVEFHDDPDRAPCDGGSALPFEAAAGLFREVADLDAFVKARRA
jgi:2-dehydro-3-deoxyphosphooctonate aldolase (KDO 8-P synthase)